MIITIGGEVGDIGIRPGSHFQIELETIRTMNLETEIDQLGKEPKRPGEKNLPEVLLLLIYEVKIANGISIKQSPFILKTRYE